MLIKTGLSFKGKLTLTKRDTTGKVKNKTIIIANRIMNAALDEVIKTLYYQYNANMICKHIAVGDDATANTNVLTDLYNEIYRVPIISKIRTGTGTMQARAILQDTQPEDTLGICTIKEVGLFAGSNSYDWLEGAGANFGLMISRVVLNPVESKLATEEIQFTWEYEFSRG